MKRQKIAATIASGFRVTSSVLAQTTAPSDRVTEIRELRHELEQRPGRVVIGGIEAKYALPCNWSGGARAEYFDDRGGLFSGTTQALKEVTFVADHTLAPGFLARAEYRRDFSNQRFFLTDTTGVLARAQTTATLGLVYWWGMKQGSW